MSIKDGKSKQTQYSKNAQYQDKLPFWPDSFYEQSNPLVRSSLFSISNRRKTYEEYTPISSIGEGSIEYRGSRLNTFDEEVYLQLIQYCRGQSLLRPIASTKRQILSDLGLTASGNNYKKLMASLGRLESGKLRISAPHILLKLSELLQNPNLSKGMEPEFIKELHSRYEEYIEVIDIALFEKHDLLLSMGFIQNSLIDPQKGNLRISLDPLLVLLFDGINTTRTDRHERSLLNPAEKKLLSYILSHSGKVFPLKLETIHMFLNSDSEFSRNKAAFTKALISYLETLERLGRIEPDWDIRDDKVFNLKGVPYSSDVLSCE